VTPAAVRYAASPCAGGRSDPVVGVHQRCTPTPYRTPRSYACQKNHARTSAQNAHTQPAVMWRARRDHGSGALIDPDSRRLRRVFPAELRHSSYARSRGTSGWTDMRVPDPQFPNKTPAGRQSSCPVLASAADGPPDPTPRAGTPSAEQLRGACCSDDEHTSLPIRSPGQHMHPALRRPPLAGPRRRQMTPHPSAAACRGSQEGLPTARWRSCSCRWWPTGFCSTARDPRRRRMRWSPPIRGPTTWSCSRSRASIESPRQGADTRQGGHFRPAPPV
jgi:hypothetical protein